MIINVSGVLTMERPKCPKCTRLYHNQEYHPAMNSLYLKMVHGSQNNKKTSYVVVAYICRNCGNIIPKES